MIWRECEEHGWWLSANIEDCPTCTGHKKPIAPMLLGKIRNAWAMPSTGPNPRAYERAQGQFGSSHSGPTGLNRRR